MKAGHWQGLDDTSQMPRYSAIAKLVWEHGGSVLDVGCGAGVFKGWLPYAVLYTGIEPDHKAAHAARCNHPDAVIHIGRAEDVFPVERFDTIVFNESLYYLEYPVAVLRKFERYLLPGGIIICSIYQRPERWSFVNLIRRWLQPNRSLTNVHCEQLVRAHQQRNGWVIQSDKIVPIPRTTRAWHIWSVTKPK